ENSRVLCAMSAGHDCLPRCLLFFFNATATTEIYTLSLHDALPILNDAIQQLQSSLDPASWKGLHAYLNEEHRLQIHIAPTKNLRSEEHTSELQSRGHLVCRLLLEKKKKPTSNGAGTHVTSSVILFL